MRLHRALATFMILGALSSVSLKAAYQYYYTDQLNFGYITGNWSPNGSVSSGTSGLTTTAPNLGGSLISTIAIPDGTNDYEVRATVRLPGSGGSYALYARATADANLNANTGTFYAFQMESPTFSGGSCSAAYKMYKRYNGSVSLLGQFYAACSDGMYLRMMVRGGSIAVFVNSPSAYTSYADADIASGKPGVGIIFAATSAYAMTNVQLGPLDRVLPPAINVQSVGTASFPNRVEMQWQGNSDDANGIGLETYYIYRDGVWFGASRVPLYIDETLQPGESHTYWLQAMDQHLNYSPVTAITLAAAPAGTTEPRRVGVRPTGSYWGAAGEQIDLLSGNLNFTLPLVKAQARGGWGATLALSYNSQQWRKDNGGTWNLGRDVGYGRAWRLMAGSLAPVYSGAWNIHHYVFTDATGAEYRLDQNTGGVWTSKDPVYISYDTNQSRLYFTDGSFWSMGAQSAGSEEDAGTMYPSLVQDNNGNQIKLHYAVGKGVAWTDSSARITSIEDPRVTAGATYTFTYNTDAIPHLTSIANGAGTGENYDFAYYFNQQLSDPFSGVSFGSTALLFAVAVPGLPATYFGYWTGANELSQMTTPLGGTMTWTYGTYTYAGNRSYREMQTRQLNPQTGSTNTWNFTRDSATDLHPKTTLTDVGAATQKVWTFQTSGAYNGLVSAYEEKPTGGVVLVRKEYAWLLDGVGRPYVAEVKTIMNPSTWNFQMKSTQTLDSYGNATQSKVYDWNSLSTPARTYAFTYLSDTTYTSRYIRNRLTQATVTSSSGTIQLASITYDTNGGCGALQNRTGLHLHDGGNYGIGFNYRGNPTSTTSMGKTRCTGYEISGVAYVTQDATGNKVTVTPASATDYSLPGILTPNDNTSLQSSVSYATSFAVTQVAGPNGTTSTTAYDSLGRPTSSTTPAGATTTYTYTYSPNTQTATLNGRWKKTTLDGFGRVTKLETGDSSGGKSVIENQYTWGAALGKLWRVSNPYASGGSPTLWTTYSYDASGRTLTVTAPDTSVTGYVYFANAVKVTDAAGKWKQFGSDAMGNLVQVVEPNPTGGAAFGTGYSYNAANQLTQVVMDREVLGQYYTQVRTFVWSGPNLTSTTNPENGTVTYQYDAAARVTVRTDAKNQQTQYTYDAYGRRTQVRHYIVVSGQLQEQMDQRWNFYYDTNPFDGSFSENANGRLTAVSFTAPNAMSYQYSYYPAGLIKKQRFDTGVVQAGQVVFKPEATYGWDNEGKLTSTTYPTGTAYGYQYNSTGQLGTMTEGGNQVASATYLFSGALSTLTYDGWTETRSYHAQTLQLTRMITASGGITHMDMQYIFPAGGANNGQIYQSIDGVTGETVTYQYDSLKRLISAQTADNLWGNAFAYDGFGNLTTKTVTKGTAPSLSESYNPANNWRNGTTYDANGNPASGLGYDVENRYKGTSAPHYFYDPSGKRIWEGPPCCTAGTTAKLNFYGIGGKKIATYQVTASSGAPPLTVAVLSTNVYFGGKLIRASGLTVATDRLGSVRKNSSGESFAYYAYGEERTSTADGREKFGTYTRDSAFQDYADQRYYGSHLGRFWNPDPGWMHSVNPSNPSSWNRFAYVNGDPVNSGDPSGLAQIATPIDLADGGGDPYYGMGNFGCSIDGMLSSCSMSGTDATVQWNGPTFIPGAGQSTSINFDPNGNLFGTTIGTIPTYQDPGPITTSQTSVYFWGDETVDVGEITVVASSPASSSWLSNLPPISLTLTAGVPLIPTLPWTWGASMMGGGVTISYIPSSGTAYFGPTSALSAPGFNIGGSFTIWTGGSPGVNPAAILGGSGSSITIQPNPAFGGSIAVSPTSPGYLTGWTFGTKSPGSFQSGYGDCWFGPGCE